MNLLIWDILAAAGFLLMLGTVGACDIGRITLTHTIVQATMGLALLTVGVRGGNIHRKRRSSKYEHRNH